LPDQEPLTVADAMKVRVLAIMIPLTTALAGAAAVALWLGSAGARDVRPRLPGADEAPEGGTPELSDPSKGGMLIHGAGMPADLPGAWPRFRGKDFDGISDETVRLARKWPAEGPPVLWRIDVGEGYAGAAVLDGRVYVLDYDRQQQADALRCLSLATGEEIWRYSYPVRVKRNHGMSRTVPAVTDAHVVSLGPKCHVTCLDSKSGQFRWSLDLVEQFKAEVPPWYAGQCPLIEAGRAILGVGGEDVLMMAVDCETGQIVWKTDNPRGWKMTHSSVMPMDFAGRRMYVYCASGGVVGVSAEDGRVLWQTDAWRIRIANIPSPLIVRDGRIFLSGGYNAGSMMLQLSEADGSITVSERFRLKPKVFGAAQHTPILYGDRLYGVRPDGQFVCLDLDGNVLWASGPAATFGLGPFMIADGLIFAMDDNGLLRLLEATPAGCNVLAQAKVLEGPDSWGPMALAGGRLILRDLREMACLDVRAQ